ncbi:MAG: SRPBCC domain-containing protein [Alphaproteobacteria bacterium]
MADGTAQGVMADGVVREIWVAAKPETVFPFFTEADQIVRWMGVEAEIDARPGGIFRCNVTGTSIARGEMVAVDPYSRVVFTWGWEGPDATVKPGASTIEVTLTAENDGTRVRLFHRGLSGSVAERHNHGWAHFMERLQVAASGGDPGPDPWAKPAAAAGA